MTWRRSGQYFWDAYDTVPQKDSDWDSADEANEGYETASDVSSNERHEPSGRAGHSSIFIIFIIDDEPAAAPSQKTTTV